MNARCLISRVVAQSIALGLAAFCFAAEPEFPMVLSADRQTYEVGETPKLQVRIQNHSSSEVYLVGSLDGSEMGWRFPKCRLEILDSEGTSVVEKMARCGNMNGLQIVDFVKVPPGGALDPWSKGFFPPYQLYRFPVEAPGIYTVRFYYSTSTEDVQDYMGDQRDQRPTEEIQHLFEKVPKLDLQSNDLILTFVAKHSGS